MSWSNINKIILVCGSIIKFIMASILKLSGFKNLESLQEFSTRYPHTANTLDEDLRKIWVCHRTAKEIPKFEDIDFLPVENYASLKAILIKKVKSSQVFLSLVTEFSPFSIFDKIYSHFQPQLATYLFTKCYLFYNWSVNAFEPVFDHFEIHKQIEKYHKMPVKTKQKKIVKSLGNYQIISEFNKTTHQIQRAKSVDLFEEQPAYSMKDSKSKVSAKPLKNAMQKAKKFFDISKNSKNPYQETFNFNHILYNMKQLPQWPRKHVLFKNNLEALITFIIHVPVMSSFVVSDKLLNGHRNWDALRRLLEKFIQQHKIMSKNNGYGRILKKYLKNVPMPSKRQLFAIPKPTVCSYIINILRRALPLGLFGRNSLRKHFFQGIVKVIKAEKEQNFMWYSLLHLLLKNKADLAWCAELGDNYIQSLIILKLFKFLVFHYIFFLLKNNFYITETGSSGFGLRFYRKNDVESFSFACLRNLLEQKQIRPLMRQDYDQRSLEKNWLETGQISEQDVKAKLRKTMAPGSEYKQPVAQVRFLPKSDESNELRIITNIMQRKSGEAIAGSKLQKFFSLRLSWRKKRLFFVKLFLEFLVEKYGYGIRPEPFNPVLEATWKKVEQLKENHGTLYFIKADIMDAFGSVKHNILTALLKRILEAEAQHERAQLKRIIEWRKTKWKVEKSVRFSFSNRPRENSVMINRSVFLPHNKKIGQGFESKFLDILDQVVMKQKVEIKGKVFRLIKGLAQGSAGRFSPQLCEIYYSSMDRICFKEFIDATDSVLLRAVDDYLFITSDLVKAEKFLELVQKGISKYEVQFNGKKLLSNLIENTQEVPYLGLIFNIEDMTVRPNYSKYRQVDLLSTIRLFDQWGNAHFKKEVFLERKSLYLNCLKLHSIVLNNFHSNPKVIRQIVFEACLVQSLRVIKLANCLYSGGVMNDLGVYKVFLKSCNKIKNRVDATLLSREEVRWLFFFAASNVLRRWSGQYKLLLMMTRSQLEKCERDFISASSELLLNLLKDDVMDEEYWGKVNDVFNELGNKPRYI